MLVAASALHHIWLALHSKYLYNKNAFRVK
jgi:hypothetical protein